MEVGEASCDDVFILEFGAGVGVGVGEASCDDFFFRIWGRRWCGQM